MKTTREVLVAARALIARPEAWTQGALARTVENGVASSVGDFATCWCAEGAVVKVGGDEIWHEVEGGRCLYEQTLDALRVAAGGIAIHRFNDTHSHADVLAAFDRAIAAESTS
jgi:hypothetical protein